MMMVVPRWTRDKVIFSKVLKLQRADYVVSVDRVQLVRQGFVLNWHQDVLVVLAMPSLLRIRLLELVELELIVQVLNVFALIDIEIVCLVCYRILVLQVFWLSGRFLEFSSILCYEKNGKAKNARSDVWIPTGGPVDDRGSRSGKSTSEVIKIRVKMSWTSKTYQFRDSVNLADPTSDPTVTGVPNRPNPFVLFYRTSISFTLTLKLQK